MKVSDILRVKGSALFTASPMDTVSEAVVTMAQHDIGSMVVIDHGKVVGMLTFREVLNASAKQGVELKHTRVESVMLPHPWVCALSTDLSELIRVMLDRHARYVPVVEGGDLIGVVSFYDVAKAIVESQDLENKALKAYINDYPSSEPGGLS